MNDDSLKYMPLIIFGGLITTMMVCLFYVLIVGIKQVMNKGRNADVKVWHKANYTEDFTPPKGQ